ncbi:restriction endonuclease subunit S [Staphylococcus argenteus]|uniref:restriction endonuclease subunit S n=1 Tax=Staphylococcus argenteus TaxID=985002 RepID=UPI00050667FA|nr:restriction endonuclease subunit S [Staphylococcus argenteus]API79774.1 restriction endonuclease subunit S [Staphylococcus argenteus]MBE2123766.1 restriction endonuclease subunit S [Staphylococcus argenteus]MBE2140563.1 restriction endonuclease subunit S [Staphylococcus argenteus]MCG6477603.1 restriction endonuclease subunit S [Staphylococcus argenteus]MCG9805023.1 restriction endonuclease subunit S [Staphylococcus argenteus]
MSNTQKKNVPELRFPEFEGEWEEKELGDVASFAKGKLGAKKDVSKTGVPIILYGELYTKYGAIVSKIFSKTDIPENKLKMASKNDVLIPSSGETAIDIATASCVYLNKGVAVGGDINILKPQKQDGRFISLSINGINKNELSKYAQGKTVVHLYNNDIKNLKIAFPSQFDEQQKIGDLFSELDRQIELEEQKLELLQQQKKGYMQKIFSQELRFKDENGDDYPEWEEKKMGEITTMFSGGTPQSTNTRYYKGDIPFIRSGEISKTYTEVKINEEALNNSSAKLVEVGDLLYALYGATSGEVAISKINGAINQAVLCIRTNESIEFLLNYLFFSKNKILNTFIQGGQGNLSANIIKNLIIEIPTIIEQRKIGDFFCNIDNLIEIQERKLEFLKQRKQSLLQKMFV